MMEPNWKPLELKLGLARCVGFMFMGRINRINLYKHGITRTYLNLDDEGNCYAYDGGSRYRPTDFSLELQKLEASLKKHGATLTTPYDDQYIARKVQTLQDAGISLLRIRVEPEDVTVN
jgi:hypothetical protein